MLDVIADTLIDAAKLVPFLFLTYLAMEYLEHRTSAKTKRIIKESGKTGPFFGALLGAFPQCGFSAAASNLYAGRVITMGTLVAIYLSTSDEMLPMFISEQVEISFIVQVLLTKIVIGMAAGFLLDFSRRRFRNTDNVAEKIGHICERDHCHCDKSIVKSALKHTLIILGYILLISFVLNLLIFFIGEDTLGSLILNRPVLGPVIAGIVGLIPNCAASVVVTQLFLSHVMSYGAMMSGLLVSAGVGLLILFRENRNLKENIQIVVYLYLVGVLCGVCLELFGLFQ